MRFLDRDGNEVPESKAQEALSWRLVAERGDNVFTFMSIRQIIERYIKDPQRRIELNEYYTQSCFEKLDAKIDRGLRAKEIDGG